MTEAPITLVSAPAGYGKSMFVSEWVDGSENAKAWISLDESDSNLTTFAEYLVAALDSAGLELSKETRSLVRGAEQPTAHTLSVALLNDLDAGEPVSIVLDDLHRVSDDSEVYCFLDHLLARAPRDICFILITRRAPPLSLTMLRAASRLRDVMEDDLRLDAEEARTLLAHRAGTQLPQDEEEALLKGLEGWAAGICLAALALRAGQTVDGFVNRLDEGRTEVEEYLVQQTLSALPEESRRCLLRASLLDRFCDDLLHAMCTTADGECALESFQKLNLFLIGLDHEDKWFRFHHLFQGLLARQLRAESDAHDVHGLHCVAAGWFQTHGHIDEALEHWLKAGEVESAAALVREHRCSLMASEQWPRLARCLAALPERTVESDPVLLVTLAMLQEIRGGIRESVKTCERALALAGMLPAKSRQRLIAEGEAEVLLCLAKILGTDGDAVHATALSAQSGVPPENTHLQSYASAEVMVGLQMSGRYGEIEGYLDETLRHTDARDSFTRARLWIWHAITSTLEGRLDDVIGSASFAARVAKEAGLGETEGLARYFAAAAQCQRGEFALALPDLEALLENRHAVRPTCLAQGAFLMSRILLDQGQADSAYDCLRSSQQLFVERGDRGPTGLARAFEVELLLDLGRLEEAKRVAVGLDFGGTPPIWYYYLPQLTPARLALAMGDESELLAALKGTEELLDYCVAARRAIPRIHVLATQGLLMDALGREEDGQSLVHQALTLAASSHIMAPFVRHGSGMGAMLRRLAVDGVTASFRRAVLGSLERRPHPSAPAAVQAAPDVELTHRELDVLELVAQRLRNKEIAESLHVSAHTVNEHLKHIYRKLAVHGRRDAARKALELGVIAPS